MSCLLLPSLPDADTAESSYLIVKHQLALSGFATTVA